MKTKKNIDKIRIKIIAILLAQSIALGTGTQYLFAGNAVSTAFSASQRTNLSPQINMATIEIRNLFISGEENNVLRHIPLESSFEIYLKEAIRQNREVMRAVGERTYAQGLPDSTLLLGLCCLSSFDLAKRIYELTKGKARIVAHNAAELFGDYGQGFLVVISPEGKMYLVDTTFIQWFDESEKRDAMSVESILKKVQKEYPEWQWQEKTERLLADGFIELDDNVANMYGCLLRQKYPLDRTYDVKYLLVPPTLRDAHNYVHLYPQYIEIANLKEIPSRSGGDYLFKNFSGDLSRIIRQPNHNLYAMLHNGNGKIQKKVTLLLGAGDDAKALENKRADFWQEINTLLSKFLRFNAADMSDEEKTDLTKINSLVDTVVRIMVEKAELKFDVYYQEQLALNENIGREYQMSIIVSFELINNELAVAVSDDVPGAKQATGAEEEQADTGTKFLKTLQKSVFKRDDLYREIFSDDKVSSQFNIPLYSFRFKKKLVFVSDEKNSIKSETPELPFDIEEVLSHKSVRQLNTPRYMRGVFKRGKKYFLKKKISAGDETMVIKNLRKPDFEAAVKAHNANWGDNLPLSKEDIEQLCRNNPQGNLIMKNSDGEIILVLLDVLLYAETINDIPGSIQEIMSIKKNNGSKKNVLIHYAVSVRQDYRKKGWGPFLATEALKATKIYSVGKERDTYTPLGGYGVFKEKYQHSPVYYLLSLRPAVYSSLINKKTNEFYNYEEYVEECKKADKAPMLKEVFERMLIKEKEYREAYFDFNQEHGKSFRQYLETKGRLPQEVLWEDYLEFKDKGGVSLEKFILTQKPSRSLLCRAANLHVKNGAEIVRMIIGGRKGDQDAGEVAIITQYPNQPVIYIQDGQMYAIFSKTEAELISLDNKLPVVNFQEAAESQKLIGIAI